VQSYKATVSYDGTNYCGWQWQPRQKTVDRVLREMFLKAFDCSLMLVGASRTDAGVHAIGQVIRVRTDLIIDSKKMMWVWNNALPESIVIKDLVKVEADFHPQHNITSKIYHYTFFMHRPDPMVARFGTFIERPINLELLKDALDIFVGSHDFRAFCKEQPDKSTFKTIDAIELKPCQKTGGFTIMIKGKSFLRFMIRRIVGAAFAAATKPTVTLDDLKKALFEKKITKALPTAPAKGLCLMQIDYYSKMEDLV
jgi:tRNA pseudouridine38-40 synthase